MSFCLAGHPIAVAVPIAIAIAIAIAIELRTIARSPFAKGRSTRCAGGGSGGKGLG